MLNLSLMNPVSLDSGQLWTPNYNGINSYLKIPDWHPNLDGNGEHHWAFEAIYQTRDPTAIEYIYDGRNEDNLFNDGYFIHTKTGKLDSPFASIFVDGVAETHVTDTLPHTIKAEHTTKNHAQALRIIGITNSFFYPYSGQIHTIHIMDFNDPTNSRFYESIITSKEMPTTTIVEDKLGERVDVWGAYDFQASVYVEDMLAFYIIEGTYSARLELGTYFISLRCEDRLNGRLKLRVGDDFVGINEGETYAEKLMTVSEGDNTSRMVCNTASDSARAGGIVNIVVEKVTDGQLINLGTEQPWVALIR